MIIRVLRWPALGVWSVFAAAVLVCAPVVALVARALSAVTRRPEPVALARLLYVYVTGELALLAGAARLPRGDRAGLYALLGRFLGDLVRAAMGSMRLGLRVDAEPAAMEALTAPDRPLLVFSRHAGAGDSVLLLHVLLGRFGREPRIVMKETLGLDPALGLICRRLPNALIGQDDDRACSAVERLAAGVDGRAALLLFPEGGNFTRSRRRSAIAWLRRHGHAERARKAVDLAYLVSPRVGGVRAAITGAPDADVVFAAHTGLGVGAKGLDMLRGLPRDSTIEMRFWLAPAAQRPRDEEGLVAWLDEWWETLDTWVEDHGRE